VPAGLSGLLDEAQLAREQADLVSLEAVALRRRLARGLAGHGYAVRDVADLLGVSTRRAQQLVADPDGPPSGPIPHLGVRPHSSYQHEAFMYRGPDEFLAGTVPFIMDGVRLGQPVMVALIAEKLELVRSALGPAAGPVLFVDMRELGRNPARIIPEWVRFVADRSVAGEPVRGIGEPIWPGRHHAEIAESQLHEALLNVAVAPDTPLWLRCPYDVDGLSPEVVSAALSSHPALVGVGSYRGSPSYGGLDHVDSLFAAPLPALPDPDLVAPFAAVDVPAVLARVRRLGDTASLAPARAQALADGVGQVAEDAVRPAGGSGSLRTWVLGEAVVCEIDYGGPLEDRLAGRRAPAEGPGRGLWLANQLCDLVQVRSLAHGCTVRISMWR
jgi:hypothetical protein